MGFWVDPLSYLKNCKVHTLLSTSNTNLGNFGFEILQGRLLIKYLRYTYSFSMANGDLTPSFNLLGDMKRGPLSRFNSLVLKMSFELIKLYNQLGPLTQKEDFFNWKQLLEEILQFLTMVDPGNDKH